MSDIPQLFGPMFPIEVWNGLRNDNPLELPQPSRFVRHQQRRVDGTKAQLAATMARGALLNGSRKVREIVRQHGNVIERNVRQETFLSENELASMLFKLPA